MEEIFYREVAPDRNISGDSFSSGDINFIWNHSSRNYFNPAKSFVKIRIKLTAAGGGNRIKDEKIAPSMFTFNNLFQSQQIMLDGKELSSTMDYVAQINALKSRMYKSNEYLESVEKYSDFASSLKDDRRKTYLSRGTVANEAPKEFDIIGRPSLALFDVDGFLPSGNSYYTLKLTPHPDETYKKYLIEGGDDIGGFDMTTIKISIVNMKLYLCSGVGAPCINKTLNFKIKETRCQSQLITSASLTQKTFSVGRKSEELTIAFQQPAAGLSTTFITASQFKSENDSHLDLTRLYLSYGGKTLPSPQDDIRYGKDQDFVLQRYIESLNYGGTINIKHSPESYFAWKARGPYYHFSGYHKGEKPDRVYVSTQFSALAKPVNILLFEHSLKNICINIRSGNVHNVSVN